jgi:hypothetical protein
MGISMDEYLKAEKELASLAERNKLRASVLYRGPEQTRNQFT